MNSQQLFSHSNAYFQDASGQFYRASYHGEDTHQNQAFFPYNPVGSGFGDMVTRSTGECSPPVRAWSTLGSSDNSRPLLRQVGTIKPEEDRFKRQRNYTRGPCYGQTWNPQWLGITEAAVTQENYEEISRTQELYLGSPIQYPKLSPDSGIATMKHSLYNSPQSNSLIPKVKEQSSDPIEESDCQVSSPPVPSETETSDSVEAVLTTTDLEAFAKELKHKRVNLGYTQSDVGRALGHLYGTPLSQTTICRFESFQLSSKNMLKLQPTLSKFIKEMETNKNLLERLSSGQLTPQVQKRKQRTSIEGEARRVLEDYFTDHPNPSTEEKSNLAATLNMEKDVVRIWFCNRRQKSKRQIQPKPKENSGKVRQTVQHSYVPSQEVASQEYAAAPMASIPAIYTQAAHQSQLF